EPLWMRVSRICLPEKTLMMSYAVLSLVLVFATEHNLSTQKATYSLVIKNHRFQPAEIEIPADQKITLIVKNDDPTPEEFESTELRREKVVPGGGQITVYVGPLKPGRYEFVGDFNPKTARGHIIAK